MCIQFPLEVTCAQSKNKFNTQSDQLGKFTLSLHCLLFTNNRLVVTYSSLIEAFATGIKISICKNSAWLRSPGESYHVIYSTGITCLIAWIIPIWSSRLLGSFPSEALDCLDDSHLKLSIAWIIPIWSSWLLDLYSSLKDKMELCL